MTDKRLEIYKDLLIELKFLNPMWQKEIDMLHFVLLEALNKEANSELKNEDYKSPVQINDPLNIP